MDGAILPLCGSPYETKRTRNLLTLPIALCAIIIADVAIASAGAAVHKDRAFQASSPKNFPAGRKTGLFLALTSPRTRMHRQPPHTQNRQSGADAAGKTGTGWTIGWGLSDSALPPLSAIDLLAKGSVAVPICLSGGFHGVSAKPQLVRSASAGERP